MIFIFPALFLSFQDSIFTVFEATSLMLFVQKNILSEIPVTFSIVANSISAIGGRILIQAYSGLVYQS